MNLLREKLHWIWKRVLQAYADYRVTVSAVAFFTIYGAVHNFLGIFDYDVREKMLIWKCFDYKAEIYGAMLPLICAAMFTESVLHYALKEKRTKVIRFCALLLAAVIAVFLSVGLSGRLFGESTYIMSVSVSTVSRWMEQCTWGYVLLLLLGTVYFCHRRSGVGFMGYMLHVLINWCAVTGVYFVLHVGIILILSIVDTLFVKSAGGTFATTGIILTTGLYYVPGCIIAMRNMESRIEDTPAKYLIRDVITGMTICALTIVYVYLLKTLLLWEIPSNEIFGIVAGLFCFGMPIWMMDYYYRDDTKYMRFVRRLPYALIPLIPMQSYAIGVRIFEHGMTPDRYMGVLMVIIEIAVLLFWHFGKEKMERVLLVLCLCVVVCFLIPGINSNSLSYRWQRAFLETYYEKLLNQGSLTQTECGRLRGAYKYLKNKPEMASVVERYDIYEESFAAMLADAGIDMKTYTEMQAHQIHCCQMVGSMDVAGYSRFDMLNQDTRYKGTAQDRIPVDFSAFHFYKREDGKEEIVTVDLSDFAKRCMAYEREHPDAGEEEFSAAMKPFQKIMLADSRVLYLNHFKVSYQDGIKDGEAYFEIVNVDISGMLLEK